MTRGDQQDLLLHSPSCTRSQAGSQVLHSQLSDLKQADVLACPKVLGRSTVALEPAGANNSAEQQPQRNGGAAGGLAEPLNPATVSPSRAAVTTPCPVHITLHSLDDAPRQLADTTSVAPAAGGTWLGSWAPWFGYSTLDGSAPGSQPEMLNPTEQPLGVAAVNSDNSSSSGGGDGGGSSTAGPSPALSRRQLLHSISTPGRRPAAPPPALRCNSSATRSPPSPFGPPQANPDHPAAPCSAAEAAAAASPLRTATPTAAPSPSALGEGEAASQLLCSPLSNHAQAGVMPACGTATGLPAAVSGAAEMEEGRDGAVEGLQGSEVAESTQDPPSCDLHSPAAAPGPAAPGAGPAAAVGAALSAAAGAEGAEEAGAVQRGEEGRGAQALAPAGQPTAAEALVEGDSDYGLSEEEVELNAQGLPKHPDPAAPHLGQGGPGAGSGAGPGAAEGLRPQASIISQLPCASLSPALAVAAAAHLPPMLGPHGRMGSFVDGQGLRLACYFWPALLPAIAVSVQPGEAGQDGSTSLSSSANIPNADAGRATPAAAAGAAAAAAAGSPGSMSTAVPSPPAAAAAPDPPCTHTPPVAQAGGAGRAPRSAFSPASLHSRSREDLAGLAGQLHSQATTFFSLDGQEGVDWEQVVAAALGTPQGVSAGSGLNSTPPAGPGLGQGLAVGSGGTRQAGAGLGGGAGSEPRPVEQRTAATGGGEGGKGPLQGVGDDVEEEEEEGEEVACCSVCSVQSGLSKTASELLAPEAEEEGDGEVKVPGGEQLQSHASLAADPAPAVAAAAAAAALTAAASVPSLEGKEAAAAWQPAPAARGTVVLVHGHGSHTGWDWLNIRRPGEPAYWEGSWVQTLNAAGFSVAAMDHQGMGRSEGQRCYVHRFQHYCDDVKGFVEALSAGIVGLPCFAPCTQQPVFLMGISLGGGIVTHVMRQLEAAYCPLPPQPPPPLLDDPATLVAEAQPRHSPPTSSPPSLTLPTLRGVAGMGESDTDTDTDRDRDPFAPSTPPASPTAARVDSSLVQPCSQCSTEPSAAGGTGAGGDEPGSKGGEEGVAEMAAGRGEGAAQGGQEQPGGSEQRLGAGQPDAVQAAAQSAAVAGADDRGGASQQAAGGLECQPAGLKSAAPCALPLIDGRCGGEAAAEGGVWETAARVMQPAAAAAAIPEGREEEEGRGQGQGQGEGAADASGGAGGHDVLETEAEGEGGAGAGGGVEDAARSPATGPTAVLAPTGEGAGGEMVGGSREAAAGLDLGQGGPQQQQQQQQQGAVSPWAPDPRMPRGAVLLAPMLSLGNVANTTANRVLRQVAFLIDAVWPSLAIVGGGSDNREVDIQSSFTQDPLTSKCKATRVRNALEYLRACAQLEEDVSQGPGCRFPFIVFHAKEDEWTSSEGSCHLYRHSKAQDKALRLLEGGTHTLTKGAQGQQLLREVRQWLLQRTADVGAAR